MLRSDRTKIQKKQKAKRISVICPTYNKTTPLTCSEGEIGIADNTKGMKMNAILMGKMISEMR